MGGTLFAARAHSEARPSARLDYVRKGAASVCPDEAGMRAAVTARLGYDPFTADADRTVAVSLTREGATFRAVIEVRDASGAAIGVRKLQSSALHDVDCEELAGSIAIALAVAIDPLGTGPAPSASASPSSAPSASSRAQSNPPPPPIPRRPHVEEPAPRARLMATFGVFAAYGAAPDLTAGLTAGVGMRLPTWSLSVEGRADLEARRAGTLGGEVKSSLLLGSLVPCLHHDPFVACVVGSIGAMRGAGAGVDVASTDTTFYAAVGPRVGLEADLAAWGGATFVLRGFVDVLATLVRTTLRIQAVDVWTTPPVAVLAGLALVGRF